MKNPYDNDAVAELKEVNVQLVDANVANKFPEAMLNSQTIDIETFKATFLEAAPIVARVRKTPTDGEARAKFEALTNRLGALNRLQQYPNEWILGLTVEKVSVVAIRNSQHFHHF